MMADDDDPPPLMSMDVDGDITAPWVDSQTELHQERQSKRPRAGGGYLSPGTENTFPPVPRVITISIQLDGRGVPP